MKTVLFKAQLMLAMSAFFLFLGGEYLKQVRIPLFALSLLVVMVGLIVLNTTALAPPTTAPQSNLLPVSLSTSAPLEEKSFSEKAVSQQIYAYEQLLQLQPTHRDLLVNTALLYQAQLDGQRSQYYWQQARKQDPNSPLFAGQVVSSL